MASLEENGEWVDSIYQLEITDPVIGGADGIDNLQAKQLANRTSFLKVLLTKIVDGTTSVGKAIKLATARKITLSGVVSGEADFDGSANISIELAYVDGQLTIGKVTGLNDALAGKQPASNLLNALAVLSVTSANKMIYSNGNSSFALTDLSAFARTILDDSSGDTMFATMGAAQSLGGSGYIKFPNGVILQWVLGTSQSTSGNQVINFPISFPITISRGMVTSLGANGYTYTGANYCWIETSSKNQATVYRNNVDIGYGITPVVFAIGY